MKTKKMVLRLERPVALTIAGSDSCGGAGIQADIKTFFSLGVYGTAAVTSLTAQNPKRVTGILPVPADFVKKQISAVFEAMPPAAIKTGMLFSSSIIKSVVTSLIQKKRSGCKFLVVVDPVMVSTSGTILLKDNAIKTLCMKLFSIADLITPNIPEAQKLSGIIITEPEDMRLAAKKLFDFYKVPVLLKGGHLKGYKESLDIFYDGIDEYLLSAPYIKRGSFHGTGCMLSAAIVSYLALGFNLLDSIIKAKELLVSGMKLKK